MIYGRYPFYSQTADELFKKIQSGVFLMPRGIQIQLDARIMLNRLLDLNPRHRPSAIRLLRTNYLQEGAVEKMLRLMPREAYQMRKKEEENQTVPQQATKAPAAVLVAEEQRV